MTSVIVTESFGDSIDGRKKQPEAFDRSFDIIGTTDRDSAYVRFRQEVLTNYRRWKGLVVKSFDLGDEEGSVFRGTVKYGRPNKRELMKGFPEYSFSTKGGTANVTQSLQTVGAYAGLRDKWMVRPEIENGVPVPTEERIVKDGKERRPVPNFQGGINYENGIFQPTSTIVPAWTSTISVVRPYRDITPDYLRMLRQMTGSVNSTEFDNMRPGECQFVGCEGGTRLKQETDDDEEEADDPDDPDNWMNQLEWTLKFEFRAAPNRKDLFVGDIGPIQKNGWDYLWVLREEVEVDEDEEIENEAEPGDQPTIQKVNATVKKPAVVYVERMYPYADFVVFGF